MMNTIQAFIEYWNNFIDDWYVKPIPHFISKNYPWSYLKNLLPDADALPEPYCGDPYNFSAIILNLNPGGVTANLQKHPNGLFIKDFKPHGTYWDFAQNFPYLDGYKTTGGGKWWTRRDKWIKRLCTSINKPTEKKPFGIDICPWHSKSWGGYSVSANNYVNNYVISFAELALKHADFKVILSSLSWAKFIP